MPGISMAQDSLSRREYRIQQANFLVPNRPWTLEIPLWLPGFIGEFGYGDISIEGEDGSIIVNPIEPPPPSGGGIGNILSRLFTTNWYLKFFFLTRVAYEQDRIKGQFDIITGAVGSSVIFNYNNKELVQANFLSMMLRLYAGYKFLEFTGPNEKFRYEAFAYAGMRTYIQRLRSELNAGNFELDITPVLIESIIGLENQFTWKRWMMTVHGDYGSLFTHDRNSFQFGVSGSFRMGRATSIKLGWNHLYVNLNDTFLGIEYRTKMTLSGPVVALALHF